MRLLWAALEHFQPDAVPDATNESHCMSHWNLLACSSLSSSTMTFVLLGVLLMWTWGCKWVCRPNSEAQIQLHCGHHGPVVGGLGGLCLRIRRSSAAWSAATLYVAKPLAQALFHVSRSVESCSSSAVEMLYLFSIRWMWSMLDLQVTWVVEFQLTWSFFRLTFSLSHLFLLKLTWNIMSLTFNLAKIENLAFYKKCATNSWSGYIGLSISQFCNWR